jgi:hypothetical protein
MHVYTDRRSLHYQHRVEYPFQIVRFDVNDKFGVQKHQSFIVRNCFIFIYKYQCLNVHQLPGYYTLSCHNVTYLQWKQTYMLDYLNIGINNGNHIKHAFGQNRRIIKRRYNSLESTKRKSMIKFYDILYVP